MTVLKNFFQFWYDFIIGDDWLIAVAIVAALVVLEVTKQSSWWWLLPIVVIVALGASLWRATR
ncbi:MAG TPA: hypothetical protein VF221_23725 [Chloroflexota bacterium]